jgi:hypothetical protein
MVSVLYDVDLAQYGLSFCTATGTDRRRRA